MPQVYITGIEYYLPQDTLDNEQLALVYKDWDAKKIYKKIGIQKRHIASKDECASDLAEKAALKLFEKYNIDAGDIDFVILCTQSPDYILPTTACILQHRLGIPKYAGAFDFNLGCSGYIYGLSIAKGLIMAGICSNVLLIMAETYTKHICDMDKSTRSIFGDGAAAVMISSQCMSEYFSIGEFVLGTDGSGANNLIIPAGGTRMPRDDDTALLTTDQNNNTRSMNHLYMNGPEIFDFAVRTVPNLVQDTLLKHNMGVEEIELFIFHQANKYMLEYLRKKMKLPSDRFYMDMEDGGNTVSATIPIAIRNALNKGLIKPGYKIMLIGFGVGYSWGGTVVSYHA
ncbi:ketoacyl-ACP synthase III [Petroclostridium sp. X23]|uniref:ketoacyl-ACP synthase III n=1 Tax=Petroclostridium sp. X23 TaxID=3045146 RepID=UPI0024AD9F64|nr:ketoacyl-ACP synthase III [Petroclostridium sp. X23]WHH58341.1 ketoacyl-ACP synthase III [Petroclostridium sp. X23]